MSQGDFAHPSGAPQSKGSMRPHEPNEDETKTKRNDTTKTKGKRSEPKGTRNEHKQKRNENEIIQKQSQHEATVKREQKTINLNRDETEPSIKWTESKTQRKRSAPKTKQKRNEHEIYLDCTLSTIPATYSWMSDKQRKTKQTDTDSQTEFSQSDPWNNEKTNWWTNILSNDNLIMIWGYGFAWFLTLIPKPTSKSAQTTLKAKKLCNIRFLWYFDCIFPPFDEVSALKGEGSQGG